MGVMGQVDGNKNRRQPSELVTRAGLMVMLRAARLGVSDHSLRRYQALGFIPAPRPYGRPGQGKGVSWGWTPAEAEHIVRRVRMLKRYQRKGKRLVSVLAEDPELAAVFNEEIDRAYDAGFAAGEQEARRRMQGEYDEYLSGPRRPKTEDQPSQE